MLTTGEWRGSAIEKKRVGYVPQCSLWISRIVVDHSPHQTVGAANVIPLIEGLDFQRLPCARAAYQGVFRLWRQRKNRCSHAKIVIARTCLSCGTPLQGREDRFVMKYFLLERSR